MLLIGEVQTPSYTGSDIPDEDVDDNENATAPPPTAPPADMFSTYAGYENTGFGEWLIIYRSWDNTFPLPYLFE